MSMMTCLCLPGLHGLENNTKWLSSTVDWCVLTSIRCSLIGLTSLLLVNVLSWLLLMLVKLMIVRTVLGFASCAPWLLVGREGWAPGSVGLHGVGLLNNCSCLAVASFDCVVWYRTRVMTLEVLMSRRCSLYGLWFP